MINIINDNFNDLAKDYYKLQEDYEKQSKEIERLNNIINEFENKGYDIAQERADFLLEIDKLNNIINELEKALKDHKEIKAKAHYGEYYIEVDEILNKLQELKENKQ